MERRKLLKTGSIGLFSIFSAFSGCILQDSAKKMRLGLVDIVNTDDEPHTVELVIEKNGEAIHNKTHQIEASGKKEKDGEMVDAAGSKKINNTWGNEKARYFFKAKFEGEKEWKTFQLDEDGFGGEECSRIMVRIDSSQRIVFGESPCRKPNNRRIF